MPGAQKRFGQRATKQRRDRMAVAAAAGAAGEDPVSAVKARPRVAAPATGDAPPAATTSEASGAAAPPPMDPYLASAMGPTEKSDRRTVDRQPSRSINPSGPVPLQYSRRAAPPEPAAPSPGTGAGESDVVVINHANRSAVAYVESPTGERAKRHVGARQTESFLVPLGSIVGVGFADSHELLYQQRITDSTSTLAVTDTGGLSLRALLGGNGKPSPVVVAVLVLVLLAVVVVAVWYMLRRRNRRMLLR